MKTMKKSRQILMLLLAVILCIGMMPGAAFAEESTDQETETSEFELYVGGIQVTEENAGDILGDGTASLTYDSFFESYTLKLNGAAITGHCSPEENENIGIYASGNLNIELVEGTVNTVSVEDNANTYGIWCNGQLYISGEGKLNISAGDYIKETAEDAAAAESCGIYADGLTISGSAVIIQAGDLSAAESTELDRAISTGTFLQGDLYIDFDGVLTAAGGTVSGSRYAMSAGVYVDTEYYGNIAVYENCRLEACGGAVTGSYYASSTGASLYNCGLYVYDNTAFAVLKGADASVPADAGYGALSTGVYTKGGDVEIDAGTVAISAGEVSGSAAASYGILADAVQDGTTEEGGTIYSGGYVTINQNEITARAYTHSPGLLGTKVSVSAGDYAVLAQQGVEIDTYALKVSAPENGVSAEKVFGSETYYTVTDADGAAAAEVVIEPLTYKISVSGLNNSMAVPVAAGTSANDIYDEEWCSQFGKNEFSEILNTSKEGYTFVGWYTDENCTSGNEYSFDTPVYEDITIYPKWVENEKEYYVPSYSYSDVTAVESRIEALPDEITLADEEAVLDAEAAYNALNAAEKYLVNAEMKQKLEDAVAVLKELKETAEKIEAVESIRFAARSKMTTLNGKTAVKVYWNAPEDGLDGYEIFRSTKRYKGYGKEAFFTTEKTSYINNKGLKSGNTYYYKVRGFKYINGEKVYTQWSCKAWRTIE